MNRNEKIAVALVVLSCLLYASLVVVPFLGLRPSIKAAVAGTLVVSGESVFWIGTLIAGRELMRRYRSRLWPIRWFRPDSSPPPAPAAAHDLPGPAATDEERD